jgi:hypothetical protein
MQHLWQGGLHTHALAGRENNNKERLVTHVEDGCGFSLAPKSAAAPKSATGYPAAGNQQQLWHFDHTSTTGPDLGVRLR